MATYTSRLKLRKPDYVDQERVLTDVDANMSLIDSEVGFTPVIASAKDPVPDYQGQLVYETDTENLYIGIDGAWILIGNRKFARGGLAAPVVVTAPSANITNTETLAGFAATVNVVAGRLYIVEATYGIQNVTDPQPNGYWGSTSRWRWASGASITTSSTLAINYRSTVPLDATEVHTFYKGFEWFPNITGQATIGLTVQGDNTTNTGRFFADAADRTAQLMVRDYGGV
jgi:hypothetical protein